jgi:hypothetical protein
MENDNNQNLIITEPEVLPAEAYDFEFITFALGLVPICNGEAAISLSNISSLAKAEEGEGWLLTMISDEEYSLGEDDMINLERLLRDRKAKQKDHIRDNMAAQIQAQQELQNGVQQAGAVIVDGRLAKKGRFH